MLNRPLHLSKQPNSLLLSLTLRLILTLFALMMLGCTVVVRPSQPPLVLAPQVRPPLVDADGRYTQAGTLWLQDLVNAYLRNCVTLRVQRGEDPVACEKGLR